MSYNLALTLAAIMSDSQMTLSVLAGYSAQSCLLVMLLYWAWRVTYNRYLHPLGHYPGPLFATISRIPYIRAYTQGRLHQYVQALHNQYGDVVRIAPDELSYRDEHAWKDIYGRSSNFPKDMRLYQWSQKRAPSIVVAPDTIHRRQKRAILQPYVNVLIERLQQRCEADPNGLTDLTEWFNYVIFDFMAHDLFGDSLRCLEEATYHPWVEVLFGTVKSWAFLAIPKYFPSIAIVLKPLVLFLCRDSLGHRNTKYRALSAKIPTRIESERTKPDFMAHVQSSSDPGSLLLPEEMLPNYSFLMMAGSETTATLLSGCTFYLLQQLESYKRLVSEIRDRFSSSAEVSLSSLGTLPYLHSVITEALRMYPPVPLGMPRVIPAGGAVISGRYVPEKTTVAVASWAGSRSSSNFSQPDLFLPERWLKDTPDGDNDKNGAAQPFSLGPRGCPGKSLAFMEAGLILARLLWSFDLQLLPECSNWDDQRAFLIWEKGPLLVKLTPRH
ncbi:cytochrome protein [Aspergillus cavernicola]|uniref:Cytochrome protein n=1 Tax=Aspergillus cavernicola TaxID=176166 RepID=A0ABR4HK53_9EURO